MNIFSETFTHFNIVYSGVVKRRISKIKMQNVLALAKIYFIIFYHIHNKRV